MIVKNTFSAACEAVPFRVIADISFAVLNKGRRQGGQSARMKPPPVKQNVKRVARQQVQASWFARN